MLFWNKFVNYDLIYLIMSNIKLNNNIEIIMKKSKSKYDECPYLCINIKSKKIKICFTKYSNVIKINCDENKCELENNLQTFDILFTNDDVEINIKHDDMIYAVIKYFIKKIHKKYNNYKHINNFHKYVIKSNKLFMKMMLPIRLMVLNLCAECGRQNYEYKVDYWKNIINMMNPNILFLQETSDILDILSRKVDMVILNKNDYEETGILITKNIHIVDENNIIINNKKIYLESIHLTDIPSILHHVKKIKYGDISSDMPLKDVLNVAKQNRGVIMENKIFQNINNNDECIIYAGDYNEPSHLDINIDFPVSIIMEKYDFIDSYKSMNQDELDEDECFTWPNPKYYDDEPKQRIDFIYTKGMNVLNSFDYYDENWISDHKSVITDVIIS